MGARVLLSEDIRQRHMSCFYMYMTGYRKSLDDFLLNYDVAKIALVKLLPGIV